MTRHLEVGGRQARGNPPLSRHNLNEGPGLLCSRVFWFAGVVCIAIWAAVVRAFA